MIETYYLINESQYHLSCQGVFKKPIGGWFWDDECIKDAGFRVVVVGD